MIEIDHSKPNLIEAFSLDVEKIEEVCGRAMKEEKVSKSLEVVIQSNLCEHGKVVASFFVGGDYKRAKVIRLVSEL